MARMYPPEVDKFNSTAEKKLYGRLTRELSADWYVLYSVGLSTHPGKPWAEVDFVLIGPPGIFCVEVKGGRVAQNEGVWYFTDRHGNVSTKYQGPWAQVGSASAALHKYLVNRLPRVDAFAVGYGVVMPDITFTQTGSDIELHVLYDERDTSKAFSVYLDRLGDYWHHRLETQTGRQVHSLSEYDAKAVLEELRPDFDVRPSLRTRVGQVMDELLRLTKEQYRILDGLTSNPRVIIRGAAGTGKTLLAVEEARRLAADGKRILFTCFNRRLAGYLKEAMKDMPRVDVSHFHGYMATIIKEAGLRDKLPQAEESFLYSIFYPETTMDALMQLDRLQQYDAVVVDEAQDLMSVPYLDVFDALVKGGINNGRWRFFFDPFQDIFRNLASEGMDLLLQAHPAQFTLTVNCRNTAPIVIGTSMLSTVDTGTPLVSGGPDLDLYWYRDANEELREITNCINRLLSEGLQPADIIILSLRQLHHTCLRDGLPGVVYRLVDSDANDPLPKDRVIRFATVQSFKGLESNAVLLIELDNLAGAENRLAIYVGASRARAVLALFIAEQCRDQYNDLAQQFGKRWEMAANDS